MNEFIHAEGGLLIDGEGQPLTLRGVALGNWLLPEGYMWKFESPGPQSPRGIEALLDDIVGAARAEEFWQRFRATFIAEADIAQIRAEGFNHVRLPINSRLVITDTGELREPGFALIDQLVDWCRRYGLWVVLDLHGAPGGQTGTNIDDSIAGRPDLFMDPRYRTLTVKLWRAIAARYRNETAVAAYDLLNEPLPNQYQHIYADQLRDLYVELTACIRETDRHHLITYEGTHWATNWEIFTEAWDPNSMLQFHKYWSAPDRLSIQGYLDAARRLGLPAYMGEGGENYVDWIQTAFQLYDDCQISWNFWTWKKLETETSPCSVTAPPGWNAIVDYAAGKGDKPTPQAAWQTLSELIEAASFARCNYRNEVVSAVLRRAPLTIAAAGFGFRGAGESYRTAGATPRSDFRSDDLVTVRQANGREQALDWNHADGAASRRELVISLRKGDWVAYDFALSRPAQVQVNVGLLVTGPDGSHAPIGAAIDGAEIGVDLSTSEAEVRASAGPIGIGRHSVRITGVAEETEVRWIQITPQRERVDLTP